MAVCRTCNTETQRVRSIMREDGFVDECPHCAPQSFEKQTDPSDKKIWIGPEYAPNDYEKRYDSDGVYYMPKPEVTAERERKLFIDTEEQERERLAIEKKRAEGRKHALSPEELEEALKRANDMIRPMIEDPETTFLV